MVLPTMAFGPENPAFGSWTWLGTDLAHELARDHEVRVFRESIPSVDVVVFLKFLPEMATLAAIRRRSAVVYCPIDLYGSATEIDADARRLRCCDLVIVHCQRLRHYFSSYVPTIAVDHHLKYTIPPRTTSVVDGPILWIGERSNLPPLVDWLRRVRLPAPLIVLTNHPDGTMATEVGFRTDDAVRLAVWSPESHGAWLSRCRAALDIKGDDFRARHKPPAKALDFLASGIPLAMNAPSSSVEALRARGFVIPAPHETERWLSKEYADDCQRLARSLRDELSLSQLGAQWRSFLHEVHDRRITRGDDP